MTDQSSMLAFITSWFTPASLFLFLNFMIGTIVLTSRFQKRTQQQPPLGPDDSTKLTRVPSILDRVKSFNLSLYKFDHPPTPQTEFLQPSEPEYTYPVDPPRLVRTPSLLDRVKSFNFSSLYRSDSQNPEPETLHHTEPDYEPVDQTQAQDPGRACDQHMMRSKSDKGGEAPARQPEKIKKSASEKSAMGHFVDEEIAENQRPATARIEKTASFGGDEGVDAKADDFINRFKQQLKLQRLDSLLRYREILNRASPKRS